MLMVWWDIRRHRGRIEERHRQIRNRRISSGWFLFRTVARTSGSRGTRRSRPTNRSPWWCARKKKKKRWEWILFRRIQKEIFWNFVQIFGWNTKYLSVATDTRIRSSPTRTFSPSDLCFDAGWTVHQQASPKSIVSDVCVLWKHDRNWYRFILLNSIAFHRLTLRMLLEAHVESQLVVGRAGR